MNTMQDNIEDAIDQNANNIGGQDYDNTQTYEVGDIVKYEEQLYICIENVDTPEEFDDTKWRQTDVLSSAGGNEIAIGSTSDITGKTKIFVEESTQRLKYKDSTTGQFTDIAGDEVYIGNEEDAPDSTKLLVDTEDDSWNNIGTEVVDTLSGNEANRAPSVRAVNEALENTEIYSTDEVRIGTWMGKPLYRKVFELGTFTSIVSTKSVNLNFSILINQVRKVEYNIYNNTNFINLPANSYDISDNYFIYTQLGASDNSYIVFVKSNRTLSDNYRVNVILEYTKTTD